ncbi:TolC family protein [Chitinimonas sp. JJ19]|uniref:TolC family protein n=1 Tax=Chitinimonas sp. JJ19 TaxID=3109352 RepID=UPI003001E1A4
MRLAGVARHARARQGLAAVMVALLAGCASVSPDGAIADVKQWVGGGHAGALKPVVSEADERDRTRAVDALLSKPLGADDAVRLAMLNNRSVQAKLAEIGVAQAELAQASRLENPTLSFGKLRSGDEVEYERAFRIDILGVLFIPWRTAIETRKVEQEKLRVAGDITRIALDTRKAWVNAVAAEQSARYMADVNEAAEASATLAKRMAAVGNFSKLAYAREQAYYAETIAQLARARQAAIEARERLVRLSGLAGQDAMRLTLPERLPDLPAKPREFDTAAQTAVQHRLDIQMAKHEVSGLASALGLTRSTGFVNALETSYLRNSTNDGHRSRGYELELQLPLFDWSGAKVARAEASYRIAFNRAAEVGINAESELRTSYLGYRSAYDLAKHYRDEIVPLRKSISEENLLRYNGMLIGVFELLADAREQVGSVNAYMEALRAFWEADANLELAATAGGPTQQQAEGPVGMPPASGGH